jgi:thiamine-monophosphate kinase
MVLPRAVGPLRLPIDRAVDSALDRVAQSELPSRGEFALIERHFKNLTDQNGVQLGIGDDAALLSATGGSDNQLVVATDSLLQDVHFPAAATAYDIGRRALCVNLSDLAAMGATPRWFTLALSVPAELATDEWLEQLSAGLGGVADRAGCALVGGDTTRGPLALTLTLIGEVPAGQALRRDGAQSGDRIYVTGTLGDGAAALEMLSSEALASPDARLFEHFYAPKLRLEEGIRLRNIASACIDVSDGLLADLAHICRASGVGAQIRLSELPIDQRVRRDFALQCTDWALSGGDDYQLCFTVPESRIADFHRLAATGAIDATEIGTITHSDRMSLVAECGRVESIDQLSGGYNHFAG